MKKCLDKGAAKLAQRQRGEIKLMVCNYAFIYVYIRMGRMVIPFPNFLSFEKVQESSRHSVPIRMSVAAACGSSPGIS